MIDGIKFQTHINYLQQIIEKVERNYFMCTIFRELVEKLFHPLKLSEALDQDTEMYGYLEDI